MLLIGATAFADNRLRIYDQDIALGSFGREVGVLGDLDQDIYGFSVSVDFDPAMLTLVDAQLGSAVEGLEPEFAAARFDNDAGTIAFGVVLALSEENIERKIDAGTQLELVRLIFDVVAEEPGETDVEFASDGAPGRSNLFTDATGNSVVPDLDGATMTLAELRPRVDDLFPDRGTAGTRILISGVNFDHPGLSVRICGVEAEWELLGIGGGTISLDAPPCAVVGWAEVEVCNDLGCALLEEGFFYEQASTASFVRGDANDDGAVDLSDGVSVFQDLFLGIAARAPCRDALDVDDTGEILITDGIYLLGGLFQGGPPPPPPFPTAGADPTPDDLPDCE